MSALGGLTKQPAVLEAAFLVDVAKVEASVTRLHPILMTSFTIVFAMIPLSLKLTSGAEARSPVAVVLIGGVLSSMLLTLVVVPVVYTLLED